MQTHDVLCDVRIACLRTMWIYCSDFCIVFRKHQRTYLKCKALRYLTNTKLLNFTDYILINR